MRIIVSFDGSEASNINLKVACNDLVGKQKSSPDQKHRLLITVMEALPDGFVLEQHYPAYETATEILLDRAIRKAYSYGVHKVDGEIVRLHFADLATILAERANAWQATALYIPDDNESRAIRKPSYLTIGNWLGLNKKVAQTEAKIEVKKSLLQPILAQLNYTELLKLVDCQLVLTDSYGVSAKLAAVRPAQHPNQSSQQPAVLVEAKNLKQSMKPMKKGL